MVKSTELIVSTLLVKDASIQAFSYSNAAQDILYKSEVVFSSDIPLKNVTDWITYMNIQNKKKTSGLYFPGIR